MKKIQEKDIVKLTRNINPELPEGLLGIVIKRQQDSLNVHFPFQNKNLYAQVDLADIKFLIGSHST